MHRGRDSRTAIQLGTTCVFKHCMTHQKCWFHDHRKNLSGTRGSTRFLGCKPSHSWSVHHSGSLRTGLGRCHRHRSGMDLVSRCPCLCTPGRPLCSSRHLLEQTVDVLSLRHFFFVSCYCLWTRETTILPRRSMKISSKQYLCQRVSVLSKWWLKPVPASTTSLWLT